MITFLIFQLTKLKFSINMQELYDKVKKVENKISK